MPDFFQMHLWHWSLFFPSRVKVYLIFSLQHMGEGHQIITWPRVWYLGPKAPQPCSGGLLAFDFELLSDMGIEPKALDNQILYGLTALNGKEKCKILVKLMFC